MKIKDIITKAKCDLFGHDWRYNFPSLANRAICTRCKCKAELNLRDLEWEPVEKFSFSEKYNTRTDDELIKQWVR
jgi:hypothetical protein